MLCSFTQKKEKRMGSFTKNFRKRQMRTKLESLRMINRYLMQRVSELAAQVKKEPTLEQLNQQRMALIRGVTE